MKILMDGYLDKNLGDDLMLKLAAKELEGHDIYMRQNELSPINSLPADGKIKPDLRLTVTGSGFLVYNYKTTLLRAREMLEDNFKCKRAVLSCNISRFPNRLAERVINKQLSGFDFITVRDKYSYDYIKSNLPKVRCEYYPDIVFSLPNDAIAQVPCEGALGISAYSCLDGSDTDSRFAELADRYVERTGNRVLLFALNTGRENDVKAAGTIKSMMKHGDKAEILKYDGILSNIRRCSKLIGIRFHSIVIALLAGVPVIPVTYSEKTVHVLEDLNFNNRIFEFGKIDFDELNAAAAEDFDAFLLDDKIRTDASMHVKRMIETIK